MTAANESTRNDRFFEELYTEHFDFLVAVAVKKFRVPDCEAEGLVHDVFLSYLRRSGEVLNVHSWMLGAICHASRYWWRQNGRVVEPLDDEKAFERPDPATTRILDSLPDQLACHEALAGLKPRDQEILRMRYFEGCSIVEIAVRLGIQTKYAQKLLTKVLRRAERNYRRKGSG